MEIDYDNAIDWFVSNHMKASPSRFQFLIISNESIQKQYIDTAEGITLRSEVIGVIIDDRPQFN